MLEQLTAHVTSLMPKSRRRQAARKILRTILTLERLEDRMCPSGPGAGPNGGGGGNTDTLLWQPLDSKDYAATASNWHDERTNAPSAFAPTTSNPVVFDGFQTANNKPCVSNGLWGAASITVQNNYSNTLTIDAGGTIDDTGASIIKSACSLTIVSQDDTGIELNGATFTVASGATLTLTDPLNATEGGVYMTYSNYAGSYLSNAGTVTWIGTAVSEGDSITDALNAPVLNTGTFNAEGGTNGVAGRIGGTLQIGGSKSETNNYTVDMTSGSFNLKIAATVSPADGYYQSAGSLTSDNSLCTLNSGYKNELDGGNVVVDTQTGTVNILKFKATVVDVDNAEIDVNGFTTNGNSTQSDLLDCSSTDVNLLGSCYLNVGTTGSGTLGRCNRWTVMKYASVSGSWYQEGYPTGMVVSTGATDVLVSN